MISEVDSGQGGQEDRHWDELAWMRGYIELMGCSESEARSVFMYAVTHEWPEDGAEANPPVRYHSTITIGPTGKRPHSAP